MIIAFLTQRHSASRAVANSLATRTGSPYRTPHLCVPLTVSPRVLCSLHHFTSSSLPLKISASHCSPSVHCRGSSLRQSTLAAHHHAVPGSVPIPSYCTGYRFYKGFSAYWIIYKSQFPIQVFGGSSLKGEESYWNLEIILSYIQIKKLSKKILKTKQPQYWIQEHSIFLRLQL